MARITLVLVVLCLSMIGFVKKGCCAPIDTKNEKSGNKGSIDPTADVSNEVNVLLDDDSGKKKDDEIAQTPESSEINTEGEDGNSNVESNNLQPPNVEDDDEEVAVKPSAGADVTNQDKKKTEDDTFESNEKTSVESIKTSSSSEVESEDTLDDAIDSTAISDDVSNDDSPENTSDPDGKPSEDESDDTSESKEKSSDESEETSKSNGKSSEPDSYVEPSEDTLDGDPDSNENASVVQETSEKENLESKTTHSRNNTNESKENDSDPKNEDETDKDTLQSKTIKDSEKPSDESEDGNSNEKISGSVSPTDSVGTSKDNSDQDSHQMDATVNNAGGDDTSNNTEAPQLNTSEAFSSLPTTMTSNLVSLSTDSGGNDGNVSKGVEESTKKIEKVSTQKDEDGKITTRSPTKEIPAEQTVTFVSEETSESTESHKISSSPVTESTDLAENNPESTTVVGHVMTAESSTVVSNTTANEPTSAEIELESTEGVSSEVEEDLGTTSMVTSTESVPSIPTTKSTPTYAASTKKAWKKTKRPTKASVEVSSTPYPDDNVTHKRKRPPVVPGRETGGKKGNKASVTSLTSTVSPSSNKEPGKENTIGNVENNEEINSTDILTEVKNTVRKIMNEYGETNVTIVVIIILIILILLLCCCMRVCRGKRSRIRQRRLRVLVDDNLVQKEIGQEKEFLLSNRDKGKSQYSDGVTLLEGSSEDEF